MLFWDYDEGTDASCIGEKELNGHIYRYAKPSGDKPVLVTGKNAIFERGAKTDEALEVLGSRWGWLASPLTRLYDMRGVFNVQGVSCYGLAEEQVLGYAVSKTVFNEFYAALDLLPIITLGSGLKLEVEEAGNAGSIDNPWKITKIN